LAESTGTERGGIDRREMLKRAAVAGVVAWTVPAVQTLNMREAMASQGSPGEVCSTIKIDGSCSSPSYNARVSSSYSCLARYDSDLIVRGNGRCPPGVRWSKNKSGSWYVTLPPGCHLVAGFAKAGTGCVPATQPKGSLGTIEFRRRYKEISNVTITFCCPTANGHGDDEEEEDED
jgi:hypothetical protein